MSSMDTCRIDKAASTRHTSKTSIWQDCKAESSTTALMVYSNNNFRAEAFQQLQFLQMATELATFFPCTYSASFSSVLKIIRGLIVTVKLSTRKIKSLVRNPNTINTTA
ncbi:hypothetical protein D5086_006091 [Populus alba]|uniref:Uncharacterized protein n=1 Tax=Populus alba TaxID=43335 RepID=A0ACC4CLQ5_POPAL